MNGYCSSCGGMIGRDCFNPEECAEITARMEHQAAQSSAYDDGLAAGKASVLAERDSYRDELLKLASELGEGDDPFAAWESLASLLSVQKQLVEALEASEFILSMIVQHGQYKPLDVSAVKELHDSARVAIQAAKASS